MLIEFSNKYIEILLSTEDIVCVLEDMGISELPETEEEIIAPLLHAVPEYICEVEEYIGCTQPLLKHNTKLDFIIASNGYVGIITRPNSNNTYTKNGNTIFIYDFENNHINELNTVEINKYKNIRTDLLLMQTIRKEYFIQLKKVKGTTIEQIDNNSQLTNDNELDDDFELYDQEKDFVKNKSNNNCVIKTQYVIAGSLDEIIRYVEIHKSILEEYIDKSLLFKTKNNEYQLQLFISAPKNFVTSLVYKAFDYINVQEEVSGKLLIEDNAFDKIQLL